MTAKCNRFSLHHNGFLVFGCNVEQLKAYSVLLGQVVERPSIYHTVATISSRLGNGHCPHGPTNEELPLYSARAWSASGPRPSSFFNFRKLQPCTLQLPPDKLKDSRMFTPSAPYGVWRIKNSRQQNQQCNKSKYG